MIFSIILLLESVGMLSVSLTSAPILLGLICRRSNILVQRSIHASRYHWSLPRSGIYQTNIQTGKFRSKYERPPVEVVKICTQYAQKGMWNASYRPDLFYNRLGFLDSNFFVAYLISIACFGLFQAIYMANARCLGQCQESDRSGSEREKTHRCTKQL